MHTRAESPTAACRPRSTTSPSTRERSHGWRRSWRRSRSGRRSRRVGVEVALFAVGAVLGLFALGFLLATVAAALATFLPTWLALLIVGVGLVLVAVVAVTIGRSQLRRGVPPVPEQAIAEAKLTGEALRGSDDG